MRTLIVGTALSISIVFATIAAAELETLAPQTARAEVANSKGVVIVDLFAEW